MGSFFALIRKDLKGYFDQPTGYILLIIFAGVISYTFFFVTPFNTTKEASVRDLFTLLPWMLGVFVPASTMRLFAEEQRDGTLEILLTQPIRGWVVLLTKFLSGLIFVNLMIITTLGIPIALSTAGNLDFGAIAAQYVGSFFLAAAFVAIGLFTSSLTRNQIVAFIVGLFINMGLMIIGLDIVSVTLASRVATLLETLSPVTHFASITRGVINLRDILYFIALVSTFLSATFLIIRGRTLSHLAPQYRNLQLGVTGLIIFSVLIGWFGNSIGGRLDLTEDQIFTLTEGTAEIVSGLDDLLIVEIYQSKDPPIELSLVGRDVLDFLADFESNSGGNVKIVHRFPEDNEEDSRRAQLAGVPPQQFNTRTQGEFQIKTGYLGLTMTYADRREVVPVVRSMDGFEYRLATLAYKMIQSDLDRKTVGFLTGFGEKSIGSELRSFAGVLQQQYDVVEVGVTEGGVLDLSGVDVLVIAGPTERISDEIRSSLYAYVDNGGKAMILVDPVVVDRQRFQAVLNQHNFADFLEKYDVVVDNNLVFDVRSHETLPFNTSLGSVLLPYFYWMRVPAADSKVARDTESVLIPWASSLGFVDPENSPFELIPLLSTTPFGTVDYALGDVSPSAPQIQVENLSPENLFQVDIGFAIEGPATNGNGTGAGSFRLVVVGDSEWLTEPLVNRNLDNLFFGLNLIDWLAQEDTLADIRSKVVSSRTLLFEPGIHQNAVQYANIVGIPVVIIILGTIRFVWRRSVGTKVYGREK